MKVIGTIRTLKMNCKGESTFTINPKDKINKIAVTYGGKAE